MPRGKLNEVYVQRIAVEWLAKDYQNTLGSGRADGLIAAQLKDGTIYTISIEAKSERTWKAINVQNHYQKMFFHAAIIGFLATTFLLILGITTTQEMLLDVIFPVVIISVVGFCILNFSQLGVYYRDVEVVKQAERYPANEKWIALSSDVYNRLDRARQLAHFKKICLKKGIGLIRVTSGTKSFIVVQPKPIPTPKNLDSFLVCYSRAKDVRSQIAFALQQPNIIPPPLLLDEPERLNELSPVEIAESVLNDNEDEEVTHQQEVVF